MRLCFQLSVRPDLVHAVGIIHLMHLRVMQRETPPGIRTHTPTDALLIRPVLCAGVQAGGCWHR